MVKPESYACLSCGPLSVIKRWTRGAAARNLIPRLTDFGGRLVMTRVDVIIFRIPRMIRIRIRTAAADRRS